MKRVLAFSLITFFTLLCSVNAMAEDWKLSLDEALKRAIEENRNIEVAKERLVELLGMKGEALAQGLPQLTATGSYQRTWRKPEIFINDIGVKLGTYHTFSAGASVNQLLFDGGKVFKAVKAAKFEEARGIQNIKQAEQQITYQVKETFYQILYTDKVIEVLDKQLKQSEAHLKSIETRYNQGIDSDYALMRQQVQVSNILPQIIDAKKNREFLVNALKVILVIPQEDNFVPAGAFDYKARETPQVEELSQKARDTRPDLAAEKLRAQSLRQVVGVERAGYFPVLNFSTALQWQGQSDNWTFGGDRKTNSLQSLVNLSWPIFDGLKTHSRVKQAQAKLLQQQYSASQFEDTVVKDVKDAREALMKSRESLSNQQKSFALARRATAIAGERFEAGLMSQLELNDTINSESTAEQNYLRAAFDCLISEAALEKAVGGSL